MKYIRDLTLVVFGAIAALALQPSVSIGQSSLDAHASNLIAISRSINVKPDGSVEIKSPSTLTLTASHMMKLKGNSLLELDSAMTTIKGGMIKIGSGGFTPAISSKSHVICPALGVPCPILPMQASVLIGN